VSPAGTLVRLEVRPRSPFSLPRRGGPDGLTRIRGGVLFRLVHVNAEPVLVRVAQPACDRVVFGAEGVDRECCAEAIERMRGALGVDLDLTAFYERFRFDPLIGGSVRRDPGLRPPGRPEPFEALAWAICEQLIDLERATAIQRRLVARLGRPGGAAVARLVRARGVAGLRDAPTAEVVAAQAPARLAAWGLSESRAVALVRAAGEVARGRVDLLDSDHERGWRRLRAIRGIGSWTVHMLALTGQGRLDQLPAGDLAFMRLVGRVKTGDPYARATEEEVGEFFSRYDPWAGLAGLHALRVAPA
jgi:3-methyladenine DNA glycosylase/8-oxoguanine DNA glycosylase